jgi:hypothetical protein
MLRTIVRIVHPDLSKDKIKRFSSHLGRVWALVLLDEAGMSPDFCNSRLRWMGESYQLYLHDTLILQQKHVDALDKESSEVVKLPYRTLSKRTAKWGFINSNFYSIIPFYFILSFFFSHACITKWCCRLMRQVALYYVFLLRTSLRKKLACQYGGLVLHQNFWEP